MFVLTQSKTYEWPVKIPDPMDGGKFREQEIPFIFNRLTKKEVEALEEQRPEDEVFFLKVIAGWKDGSVVDESGDVPFSWEAFNALIDRFPLAATKIISGFLASVAGIVEKN